MYEYLRMTMTSVVEHDVAEAGAGEKGSSSGLLLFGLGPRGTVVAK